MKRLFYLGTVGFALFEILNVYFIMPMPGSQRMESLDLAYFLYSYRWYFRIAFLLMIVLGMRPAFTQSRFRWARMVLLMVAAVIGYVFNFVMTADHMFLPPRVVSFAREDEAMLNDSAVVVAIEHAGEVKAYPVRYLIYHHQVQDSVGGLPVMVTYCSVCRTGRVYSPMVQGSPEHFRLAGMDHFNAMFEDETTGSWWRQVSGEAVTGPRKGLKLQTLQSTQVTVGTLRSLYPRALVMLSDKPSLENYDSVARFEKGKSTSDLTRTDTLSWNDKSWVIGIETGGSSKAFDWNALKDEHMINDYVGGVPVVIALSDDGQSFAAFRRPDLKTRFTMRNDSLITNTTRYDLLGFSTASQQLERIQASQEFWHSWRTFHPLTERYGQLLSY